MKAPELALTVQYATGGARLPTRAGLRDWAQAALRRSADITLRVVGAREGRALNARYRDRDYATNVLTFVYADQRPLAGDIVLCAPIVAREAKEQGVPIRDHYAHLVVHGVLHLQGYDHQRRREASCMERLEARILARIGVADPYRAERSEEKGVRGKIKKRSSALPHRRSPRRSQRSSPLTPHSSPLHVR